MGKLHAPAGRPRWLARVGRYLGFGASQPHADDDVAAADPFAFPLSMLEAVPAPDEPLPLAPYLRWLLAAPQRQGLSRTDAAARLLSALDAELGTREGVGRLLRRAPHVVPRLMEALRSERCSSAEIARCIERDVVLVTEVMRLAGARIHAGSTARMPGLPQAVEVLGTAGLNEAIARVLLRPLFQPQAGSRAALIAQRVQEDGNRCAGILLTLAAGSGIDPVNAHLAGLLQAAGWNVLVRALEQRGVLDLLDAAALDEAFANELFARRDALVAKLLLGWNISAPLSVLARVLLGGGEAPLLDVLRQAGAMVVLRRLQTLSEAMADTLPLD